MSLSATSSVISEATLRDLLLEYRRTNWCGIQTPDTQEKIVEDLIRDDGRQLLDRMASYVELTPSSRILDIGSGVGGFVIACRNHGLRAVGIEPDRIGQGSELTSIQIARRRIAEGVFANGMGEVLPFADACFDAVILNQVIEHVRDQAAVIREAGRVVRPGGVVYIACPNYLRFYEPHYKIFWLPLLPKFFGRVYLRIRGRSPALLDQLTYTTNLRLRTLCTTLGSGYKVLDLHRENFLRKSHTGSFAAGSTRIANRLTGLIVVGRFFRRAILTYVSIREGGSEMIIVRNRESTQC